MHLVIFKVRPISGYLNVVHYVVEDKADDLLVLKKSIKSVDYKKSKEVFNWILDSYGKNTLKSDNIIDKIGEIESRGRYIH